MDTLANIRGFSYSLTDLYSQISQHGWEVKNIKYDKKTDRFIATAKNAHGDEISGWGPSDKQAVSNLVVHVVQRNEARMGKVSMWNTMFTDQLKAIAEAYSKAPLYEPKAAIAFMELGRDSENRAKALTNHLEITVVNNPEPYASPEKMFDDIRKRRQLEVSRAGIDHPIWTPEQVIAYRIVHDILGHCASGGGFDWEGANQAFAAHAAIIPQEAQKALFTEAIASTAYATYYRAYGPLKVAIFPEFIEDAQTKENKHPGHRGLHPAQSIPPIALPSVKPLAHITASDCGYEFKLPQKTAEGTLGLQDPNSGWQSGVEPLPINAAFDYQDPLGALPPRGSATPEDAPLFANSKLVDTEWYLLNEQDPADVAKMKLAITNAFRVVLLSPRKNLRWNAIHYQDISNVSPDESDPTKYWQTLEKSRQEWNVSRFGEQARYQHMPYYKQWKDLERLMYDLNPQAGWPTAQKEAEQWMFRRRTQIENQIMAEDAHLPDAKQKPMYAIENETNKRLSDAIKFYIKEHQLSFDFTAKAKNAPPLEKKLKQPYQGPGTDTMFDIPQEQIPDMSKYGAWMGTHLQSIAQISMHVDEILKAALWDVKDPKTKGAGYHFRATVLGLNISGVGPKVCSFAWLLLAPMTSQLATIDVHMMEFLGHNYEKEMNPRDYFKFERELAAGRDASGYGHVPLGMFQWGTWDYKRTGPGTHQDHSAMRVLEPVPHNSINWEESTSTGKGWTSPQWWTDTEEARNAVGEQYDRDVAENVPNNVIPFNQGAPPAVYAKVAKSNLAPWFTHPWTQEQVIGNPGQTIMQHLQANGIPLEDAWRMSDNQVGKR